MTIGRMLCVLFALVIAACGAVGCEDSQPSSTDTSDLSQKTAEYSANIPIGTSLLGKTLFAPALDPAEHRKRQAAYNEARVKFNIDPSEENTIWVGRRLAYLGKYNAAILAYFDGLAEYPDSYRLLRHRGHRLITVRRFDRAILDLTRASELIEGVPDEIELDGMPNEKGIPRSTTNTNIYYHLGLAHYLTGDFAQSADAYRKCLERSKNDDMVCASAYWLYLSLRRLGDTQGAQTVLEPIHREMDIIENFVYHKLLLLFKGELTVDELASSAEDGSIDDATLGYGIAAWHLVNGEADQAQKLFEQIVQGPMWPAFGHIAAEAELARAARPDDGSDS